MPSADEDRACAQIAAMGFLGGANDPVVRRAVRAARNNADVAVGFLLEWQQAAGGGAAHAAPGAGASAQGQEHGAGAVQEAHGMLRGADVDASPPHARADAPQPPPQPHGHSHSHSQSQSQTQRQRRRSSPPPGAQVVTLADSSDDEAHDKQQPPQQHPVMAPPRAPADDELPLGCVTLRACSTTKGRGYVLAGEEVQLRFPPAHEEAGGGGKGAKGGRGGKPGGRQARPNEIVRFASASGYEVGRLPATARPLIAVVQAGHVRVRATVLECPEKLAVMDTILLQLEVAALPALFRSGKPAGVQDKSASGGWGGASAAAVTAAAAAVRGAPLTQVLELLRRKPCVAADFTPEAFEAQRKRALEHDESHGDGEEDSSPAAKRARSPDGGMDRSAHDSTAAALPGGATASPALLDEGGDEAAAEHAALASLSRSLELEGRSLPLATPPATLSATLRDYQRQALHFMLAREQGEDNATKQHPSWEAYAADEAATPDGAPARRFYHNVFTGECSLTFPSATRATRGGLLCDSMGLGKTVETIALIAAAPPAPAAKRRAALQREAQASEAALTGAGGEGPSALQKLLGCAGRGGKGGGAAARRVALGGTLIVAPMSLLGQWRDELERHVARGTLRVSCYYGHGRDGARALAEHDVVVTTYGVLAAECGAEGPLLQVRWWRVVLDEAHSIKGRGTVAHRAACALHSERRWCLTGTPIQNSLEDLYSLLKFLRVEPWCHWGWWSKLVQAPADANDPKAMALLRGLLVPLTLRRTKDTLGSDGAPILTLPPADIRLVELDPTDEECDFYQALFRRSKTTFDSFVEQGRVLHEYATVLELLLRLRQCCNHPFLVMSRGDTSKDLGRVAQGFLQGGDGGPRGGGGRVTRRRGGRATPTQAAADQGGDGSSSDSDGGDDAAGDSDFEPADGGGGASNGRRSRQSDGGGGPTRAFVGELVKEMKAALAGGKSYECPVCLEPADDAVLTPCAHVACRDCLLGYWSAQRNLGGARPSGGPCPTCRADVDTAELITAPTKHRFRVDIEGQWRPSAKVSALFEELRDLHACGEKAVVFSQWTTFLDLLEVAFRKDAAAPRDVQLARLDGTVSQANREKLLRAFSSAERGAPNVLLVSLKAGGTGLNLVSASRCYLMDPWWNPAVEDQAIHRLHRVGQTRSVRVRRFVVRDSVERRMLEVQGRKGALVDGALNEAAKAGGEDARARRIEELKSLFR